MKVEKRERKQTYEVYVANDGSEFLNKEDCRKYEESYGCTLGVSYNKLVKKTVCANDYFLPYDCTDYMCDVVCPETLDDIVLLNAYINNCTFSNSALFTIEHLHKTIGLVWGYDCDWCDLWILDEYADKVRNKIAELMNVE